MNCSLEKISAVDVCNTQLAFAQKKKVRLERRRRNMGESIDNFNDRIDRINTELASVQVLLETFTAVCNALPECSKDKVCMYVEVKRLEVRKAQLDKMAITCNVHLLLAKQVDYNKLDSQVSMIDSYIAAIQNKRSALVPVTLPEVGHVEAEPLRSRSSEGIPISDEENMATVATSISAPAVKRRIEKNVYRSSVYFSGLARCTRRTGVPKKLVQLPMAFICPLLKPPIMYGMQSPREYL